MRDDDVGPNRSVFQPGDSEWLRDSKTATLDEIEDAARRLVVIVPGMVLPADCQTWLRFVQRFTEK